MTERRRLFFALEPGVAVRRRIHAIQASIGASGKAVETEKFHVTLAFLGMQPPSVIPRLLQMASLLTLRRCTVSLDRIGQFRRTGVLWLGSSQVPEELETFRLALVEGLEQAGVDRDRKPWELHVTLYRRLKKVPTTINVKPVNWPLEGFSLIESVRVNNDVEYRRHGHWGSKPSAD